MISNLSGMSGIPCSSQLVKMLYHYNDVSDRLVVFVTRLQRGLPGGSLEESFRLSPQPACGREYNGGEACFFYQDHSLVCGLRNICIYSSLRFVFSNF